MRSRGDTIIEVIFATAVGGLIIVISIAVMNRGVATAQMALEHTLVRQAVDGQAEALRFTRDVAMSSVGPSDSSELWEDIKAKAKNETQLASDECPPSTAVSGRFFLDITDSSIAIKDYPSPSPGSPFAEPGDGLWIEAVKNPNEVLGEPSYIDFHLRACWDPPFSGPQASIKTIVRLYE